MATEAATWEDLRVLLAVRRGASFLAAGRALGLSTSTVARRISLLEAQVGARLVRRGAAGTTLEPTALGLVALAERIEADLAVAARDVRAEPSRYAGTVRVSLGEGFVKVVSRLAAAFRREHPETEFELVAEDRLADLPRREADLAIRTVRSTSATVLTRRLGELRYGLFATDGYLRGARRPAVGRGGFAAHDFLVAEGPRAGLPETRWLRARGATRFPIRSSTADGVVEACLAGQGIAALPTLLAAAHPALRRIETDDAPPVKPVYLAMHRDLRAVPRVRAFADHLAREAKVLFAERR